LSVFLFACKEKTTAFKSKAESFNTNSSDTSNSTQLSWIDNFRKFRTAICQGDKATVKTFIDFPIMNENNELWDLVFLENENQPNKISDSIKPFSEKDFDKYFNKIFSKQFITSILKVKTAELEKNGQFQTIEFSEGKSTFYHMAATYIKSDKELNLNLSSKTIYENDDDGEFNILYHFKVSDNGQIKFSKVRLAG
jgi:predicted DNA binding CopG/RHH family protein